MRGADRICDDELWKGTAKAAEGNLSQKIWAKAKEEGLKVAINWQDADSSSAKGFRYSFSHKHESKVMCGGHVGKGWRNLKVCHPLLQHILPCTNQNFLQLNQ